MLFDFDKINIKPKGRRILDRLVKFLNENKDKRIDLEGHTDWIGTEKELGVAVVALRPWEEELALAEVAGQGQP